MRASRQPRLARVQPGEKTEPGVPRPPVNNDVETVLNPRYDVRTVFARVTMNRGPMRLILIGPLIASPRLLPAAPVSIPD